MADEANRDEVEKCKRIAENAIANGDGEKAVRFLQKAKRMAPGDGSIDDMLGRAAGARGGPASSPSNASEPSGARHRSHAAPPTSGSSATSAGATRSGKHGDYTPDQMQLVQRILRTKDYYTLLEVSKEANEDQIKKAYKKLALKLHPDKNRAPGAEEAFKKVSKAVQCLTDEDKRQVYDRYGDEDRIPQQQRGHYNQDFMSAEDIFTSFFTGNMHHAGRHHHHHQHHQGGEQQGQPHLMQMLPVLFLIFITIAGNFASQGGGSRFSFSPTHQYKHERVTASLDVTYYVTDDFADRYAEGTQTLAEFERQVEIYHVRNLHSECDYQEKTMHKKIMTAKRLNNQEQLAKARKHPRPACKELEQIKRSNLNIFRSALYMGGGY